ncbi:MAG: caspase family protein, partial [Dehalococcoidia bacterium]|nr:caspase family protein [Dehalococcoidia bacterium]
GKLRSPEDGAKRYAIIIGSNYESLPEDASIPPFVPSFATRLNWAVNDAYAMAGLLAGFDEVITLIGSGPTGASRANILQAIQNVKRHADEDDEVVFYYSGHGAQQLRSEKGKGWGAASEGIVTDEGNKVDFIWDKDLAKAFNDFESERMVFIFDACLTGGMTELAGEDRLVLMATGKDGIAVEDAGPDDPSNLGIGQGFFTFFLMAALTGNAPQVDAMLSNILGVDIQNPYTPVPGAPVSVEQAFDYASWSLLAVSPLVYGGLEYYFGPEIAGYWDTPTVIDRFRGDLLL